MKVFLSTKEAAKIVGVSHRTIQRWVTKGVSKPIKGSNVRYCWFGQWNDAPQCRIGGHIYIERDYFISMLNKYKNY